MNKEKKRQQQRNDECVRAKCPYVKGKCIVLLGKDCARLGGRRIPTQRLVNDFDPPIKEEPTHGMRPYYSSDGWASDGDEWR